MKLFKMVVCAVALFAVAPSAFAELGKIPRDEVPVGALSCMEKATKEGRQIASKQRSATTHDGQESGSVSAQ